MTRRFRASRRPVLTEQESSVLGTSLVADTVSLVDVSRLYHSGAYGVRALTDISFAVAPREAVALMGPSGSGKTTLLNLIAGLDAPTSGRVVTLGCDLSNLSERRLAAFRARSLGFVFQDPHLLPGLTALENVAISRLPWRARNDLEEEARELLEAVGLGERLDFPPARLSGGERQRVALARALVGKPPLLLADEPTGNLDGRSTEELLSLLSRIISEFGSTLVVATHDPAVAAMATRVIELAGGRVAGDSATLVARETRL